MGKDHTNIEKAFYEMLQDKCAADYPGEDYKEILKDNAPNLDMTKAPAVLKGGEIRSGQKSKKEK